MAEVAAGIWAAEEAVSTTAQLGVAAYMVSKPTAPLKATFSQIATAPDDGTKASLVRSNHSLTIIGQKAYIFGGEVNGGKLAENDVHVLSLISQAEAEEKGEQQYALLPAVTTGETGGEAANADGVPSSRSRHAACPLNVCLAIFGGVDANGEAIEENGRVWLFNSAKTAWESLSPKVGDNEILIVGQQQVPEPRAEGQLFLYQNNLVLYGGFGRSGEPLRDTWHFSYASKTWTQLPDAPVASTNASLTDGTLYLLSSSAPSANLSAAIHSLVISTDPSEPSTWTSAVFPTNPLTPSPKPRISGGLLPILTGHGRHYLLHFFGTTPSAPPSVSASDNTPQQFPDLWTLQLPSTPGQKPTFAESLRPAALKDTIRSAFKADTGTHAWAEVDVQPPSLETIGDGDSGKLHPGPRAYFGSDVMEDGRTVVLWGGVNAKGEREGDGWMIGLE